MQKKNSQAKYDACVNTPFACLGLRFDGDALVSIDFLPKQVTVKQQSIYAEHVSQQILDYCSKKLDGLQFDIKTCAKGTEFQQKVWHALTKIPPGSVVTYGDLARQLGTSARAVGNACRNNPVPLVIPCHRVVSKKGPGGYAGHTEGGVLDIKLKLLEHEGVRFV